MRSGISKQENNMETIIIKPISMKNVPDIQRYCYVNNTLIEVEKRIRGSIERQNAGEIIQYIAEADGHAIGTMTVVKETHPLYSHKCRLDDVVVGGEYQGRGIARKIFKQCVDWCVNNGIKIMTVGVRGGEPAEQVYRKLGFVEYGRLSGGIVEYRNDNKEYDEVYLFYEII